MLTEGIWATMRLFIAHVLALPLGTRPHTNIGCSTSVLSGVRLAKQTIVAPPQRHEIEGTVTLVDARHSVPPICHNDPLHTTALQSSSAR